MRTQLTHSLEKSPWARWVTSKLMHDGSDADLTALPHFTDYLQLAPRAERSDQSRYYARRCRNHCRARVGDARWNPSVMRNYNRSHGKLYCHKYLKSCVEQNNYARWSKNHGESLGAVGSCRMRSVITVSDWLRLILISINTSTFQALIVAFKMSEQSYHRHQTYNCSPYIPSYRLSKTLIMSSRQPGGRTSWPSPPYQHFATPSAYFV